MIKYITLLMLLVCLILPSPIFAAKKLIRTTTAKAKVASYSSVRLNRASHSAIVTFTNTSNVKSVEYTLNYSANGIAQGAVGSFIPGGAQTRDLYFGTCSKGVCTPHYGITGATLIVKTIFTSGASYTKRYRFSRV